MASTQVLNFLHEPIMENFPGSTFLEAQLDVNTAPLAAGHLAVCCSFSDDLSREVVDELVRAHVKLLMYDPEIPLHKTSDVTVVHVRFVAMRNLHLAHVRMHIGDYTLSGLVGYELRSKTIGVLGTGAVGTAACRIFKGFGCKVLACDIRESDAVKALGVEYVVKEQLLRSADIISLHCPALPSTRHIIDKSSIAMMKPGAILVNVSRDSLVEMDVALEAVESGQLGGLALDVYEHEGVLFSKNWTALSPTERFKSWDRNFQKLKSHPNVLVTPRSSFLTEEALANIAAVTVNNIREFSVGRCLTHQACLKALDFALEHFPTGYSYHLVHMQPRPYASPFVADESAAPEYDYGSMRSAEMTAAAASNKFLKEVFVPKAKSAGADVFAMVLPVDSDSSSQIGAAICEYADKTKADALIMMRQNKSAVERFFMGSVSRYCAVNSPGHYRAQ
ncbi:2-hydroxyacid dehydrogenase homolog 2 [Coccomyxa sp. Obi]|nr:2-hydroxyacid dehydrogenase homolog 2 [Coccomyxa sp. Obi]